MKFAASVVVLLLALPLGCPDEPRPPYAEEFFSLPRDERRKLVRTYTLSEQFELQIFSMYVEAPQDLAPEIAKGGEAIVPALLQALSQQDSESAQLFLLMIAEEIEKAGPGTIDDTTRDKLLTIVMDFEGESIREEVEWTLPALLRVSECGKASK